MPELSRNRRLLVLAICCMSLLIVGMDVTIVNVALPSLSKDLHTSLSGLQWTLDAYTLVLASLLVLSGSTADRLGRRRIFQTGLAVFTLGSLLCSIAPGLGWLVAFRMVQAVGGSMLNPVAMSIITNVFTDARERAFAIGMWGGTVGISLGLGPLIGGLLIETVGWRGIFWINIPIGLVALVLTALFVPESRAARARPPDPAGQVFVIITLAALTYAIIEAPRRGWSAPSTLALIAVSVLAAVLLVWHESRRTEPLIDPRFFHSVPFAGATVTAVCAFGAFAGFLFLNTLYLQDVRGYSALLAGVCTLPLALGAMIFAPLSGRIVGTRGPRLPLLVAGVCMVAGAVMLLGIGAGTSMAWVAAAYAVYGIGFGTVNAPITNSAVSGMPNSQAGVAAAVASTSRQVGATLGVAVVGSVLNSGLAGEGIRSGFTEASAAAWWVIIGCGLAVLVLGAVTTGRWARSTAGRAAHLFDDEPGSVSAVPTVPAMPT
jgi:EmrB/QacA subfamily drug resistance transporter